MNSKFLCCILAAMIPTTFLSCSKQEESDRSAPVIKTVGRIVAAKPEGGLYDIGYTLTDNISGASVKPDVRLFNFSCPADWCGDFGVDDTASKTLRKRHESPRLQ